MASYAAVIEVQLKNQQQLGRFTNALKEAADYIRAINKLDIKVFGGVTDNARSFNKALRLANANLRAVSLSQGDLTSAAKDYVTALEQQEAAQKRINNAVKAEQNLRRFSPAARASQTTRRSPAGLLPGSQDTLATLAGPFQGRFQKTGARSQATGSFNPNQLTRVPDAARAAWSRLGDELNAVEKAYNTTLVNLGSGRGIEAIPTKVAQGWRKVQIDFQNYQSDVARAGSRSGATSPIFGSVDRPGSRNAILANAPRQPVGGATNLIGSPAAVRRDERLLSAYNKRLNEANASIGAFTDDIDRLRQTGKVADASLKELDGALDAYTKAVKAAAANPELSATRERRNLNARVGSARRQSGQNKGLFRGSAREAFFTGIQGGAFPLLFGQGAGAAAGGAFGGVLGGAIGGNAGFALSALFTTIGAQVDVLTQSLTQLGKALDEPTAALQSLEFLGQSISKDTKAAVQFAESIGDAAGAAAILDAELRKAFGDNGVKQIQALSSEQKELQKAWGTLTGELATALIPTLILVTRGLADFTKELQGLPLAFRDAFGGIIDFLASQADDPFVKATFGGSGSGSIFEAAKSAQQYLKEIDEQIGRQSGTTQTNIGQFSALQSLETAEAERRQRRDAALGIQDAGRGVARAREDLERRIADVRLDLQDQVFRKEEELARSRIDAERQLAQIRIEQTDQRFAQDAFDLGGAGGELLEGVREFVRIKAEGEASIRQEEKLFQLDQERRQIQFAREKLQNERKIEDLQRSVIDYGFQLERYKIQVADYQFDQGMRAAKELQATYASIMNAAPGAGLPDGVSAGGGGRYVQGNIGPTSTGPHFHIEQYSGKPGSSVQPFSPTALDRYAYVNDRPLSQATTFTSGYGAPRDGGRRRHAGLDFAGPAGSALTLRNGAKFVTNAPNTSVGDVTIFEAGGKYYRIIHGDFQGGVPSGAGSTPSNRVPVTAAPPVPDIPTPRSFSERPELEGITSGFDTLFDENTRAREGLLDLEKKITDVRTKGALGALTRGLQGEKSRTEELRQQFRVVQAIGEAGVGRTDNARALLQLQARAGVERDDQLKSLNEALLKLRESEAYESFSAEQITAIADATENRVRFLEESLALEQKILQARQAQQSLDTAGRLGTEARTTGAGISRFGFGRGAQEYESSLARNDPQELAEQFGRLGELLQKQADAISDSQQIAGSISDAFRNAITVAIAGGDIQQVAAGAFAALGEKFLEIAFRPLEDFLARQLFEILEVDTTRLQEQAQTLAQLAQENVARSANTAVVYENTAAFAAATATLKALQADALAAGLGNKAAGGIANNIVSTAFGAVTGALVPGAKIGTGIGAAASAPLSSDITRIAFSPGLSLGRAFGGFVAPGSAYPVGENGPELFVPGESGTIVDDPFAAVNAGLGGQPSLADLSSGDSGPGNVQVEYSGATLNFNGSEYVAKEDVPRIVDQAVKQSYGYTQNRLRSRPTDRRRLGM